MVPSDHVDTQVTSRLETRDRAAPAGCPPWVASPLAAGWGPQASEPRLRPLTATKSNLAAGWDSKFRSLLRRETVKQPIGQNRTRVQKDAGPEKGWEMAGRGRRGRHSGKPSALCSVQEQRGRAGESRLGDMTAEGFPGPAECVDPEAPEIHSWTRPRGTTENPSAGELSESDGRFPWKELGAGSGPAFPGQSSAPATGALDTPPSPAQGRGWEHGDPDVLPPPRAPPSTCTEQHIGAKHLSGSRVRHPLA